MVDGGDGSGQTTANEENILVLQDFALSKRLSKVPGGSEIPDQVFQALGVVLGFLMEEDSTFIPHPDTNRG